MGVSSIHAVLYTRTHALKMHVGFDEKDQAMLAQTHPSPFV